VAASDRGAVLVALGLAVRRLRTERGMTQEALAEASGLHPRYVSDIERGRRNVGIVNLDRLAVALEVRLDELMAKLEDERRNDR
jgi:transcriptional regulator with XRE-family HTH domain